MNRISAYIIIFILVFSSHETFGQQITSLSHFQSLSNLLNPAHHQIVDYDNRVFDANLIYRSQWSSFEDAPKTYLASAHFSQDDLNMSIGGYVISDQFGVLNTQEVSVQYAYKLNINGYGSDFLTGGLALSLSRINLMQSKLDPFEANDDLLNFEDQSRINPNLGIGIYYQSSMGGGYASDNHLFAGVSVQQLLPSDILYDGRTIDGNLKRESHFFGYVGFRKGYEPSTNDFLEVSLSARQVFWAPTQYSLGYRMSFNDQRFIIGAAVTSDVQFQTMAGLGFLEDWQLLYSYSGFVSQTFSANIGATHEIGIRYLFVD